jgi:hypothetical protein
MMVEPSGIEPQRLLAIARQLANAAAVSRRPHSRSTRPRAALGAGSDGWTLEEAAARALIAALGLPEVREALHEALAEALRGARED